MRESAPTVTQEGRAFTSREGAGLLGLLAAAGALRFLGLDWDEGFLLHPDERNLVRAASRLALGELRDPGFHAYNGFALYLDRLLAEGLAALRGDPSLATDPAALAFVGRWVSALASTLTVAALYFFVRSLLGSRPAFVAAALLGFAPGAIQAAHFATTESLLVLFGVGCAAACSRMVTNPSRVAVVAAAVFLGLATGTKTAGLAYLAMPATALALTFLARPARAIGWAVLGLSVASLVAAVVSPHTWIHYDAFLASMAHEGAIASGAKPVFYTLSFVGTTPWWDPFQSLHWLGGLLLPSFGTLGLGLVFAASRREPEARALLPLAVFCLVYFVYVGSWHAKFVRYLLPLLPGLAVGAAFLCTRIRRGRGALVAALGVTTLGWGLAFSAIYARPDPRITASQWLAREAQPGDAVALERNDVVLPLLQAIGEPERHAGWLARLHSKSGPVPMLHPVWLDGFATDPALGLETASQGLAAADWLVLPSRRVHAVTRAHPEAFPHAAALYESLFRGELGWVPAARFASQPSLLGWELPDEGAEETFRVFDHPTVLVFRNDGRLAPSEVRSRVRARMEAHP